MRWWNNFDDIFSRLATILACDKRTDGKKNFANTQRHGARPWLQRVGRSNKSAALKTSGISADRKNESSVFSLSLHDGIDLISAEIQAILASCAWRTQLQPSRIIGHVLGSLEKWETIAHARKCLLFHFRPKIWYHVQCPWLPMKERTLAVCGATFANSLGIVTSKPFEVIQGHQCWGRIKAHFQL